MNTQLAFAFGMLAMIIIAMIAAIVVGVVRVIKLEKSHKELDRECSKETEFIHRHITDTERTIYSEINETRSRFDVLTEALRRELQAYTDSRIDKVLGTTKKQIIKD
jgi:CHASE1-domain containing sensor protein